MARWMLSLGMFSARAARIAARRRGFMLGSGRPILAATVISRASLENTLERTASTFPFRCMMFLNCECPAMGASEKRPRAAYAEAPVRPRKLTMRWLIKRERPGGKAPVSEGMGGRRSVAVEKLGLSDAEPARQAGPDQVV